MIISVIIITIIVIMNGIIIMSMSMMIMTKLVLTYVLASLRWSLLTDYQYHAEGRSGRSAAWCPSRRSPGRRPRRLAASAMTNSRVIITSMNSCYEYHYYC